MRCLFNIQLIVITRNDNNNKLVQLISRLPGELVSVSGFKPNTPSRNAHIWTVKK